MKVNRRPSPAVRGNLPAAVPVTAMGKGLNMSANMRDATAPYGAYHGKRAGGEDEALTHVARGTPCGEYLRRFWQPVAMSSEVADVPLKIRILGEELILFRDLSGSLGLLEMRCVHRNTSLEFGLIRERGIQCCYHGWRFDVDGTILEIPGEPAGSTLRQRLCQGAYPVHEFEGLVFAYLGPPERKPEFPVYDFMVRPHHAHVAIKWHSPCNWLQIRENAQDPLHFSFLHSMFEVQQFGDWAYELPVIETRDSPLGQITYSARRINGYLHVRAQELLLPNIARVPDIGADFESALPLMFGRGVTTWVVPWDDTNAMTIGWFHISDDMDPDERRQYLDMLHVGQTGHRAYEARRRAPGDWDAWVLQGPISVHDNEHLSWSDSGVAMFRRQIRDGIEAVRRGDDPKGIVRDAAARPIPTNAHNRVKGGVAEAGDARAEQDLWRAFARESLDLALAGKLAPENVAAPA